MQQEFESFGEKDSKYNYSFKKDSRYEYEYKPREKFNLEYLNNNVKSKRVCQFLFEIHKILGGCKTKAIILPGLEHTKENFYLISEELLEMLMNIHPEDSCLILQPKELPSDKTIYIWKKWERMQSALKNIEQWPAIFLWNDTDSIFIPLKGNIDNELKLIFNSIHYHSGFEYLREYYYGRKRRDRMTYILHLSDLHFGTKASSSRKERLLQIIDNQMKEVEKNDKIYTVVTGDLMNTPSESNKYAVEDFMKIVKYKTGNEPIIVQGNHDVRYYGVVPGLGRNSPCISSLVGPKVQEIKSEKLLIIKIDSNQKGFLARGSIDESQLIELGNELDNNPNSNTYTKIAILHHHPISIQQPDWMQNEWYESLCLGFHERTMELDNAPLLLEWLKLRNIKLVLHGHKHIPYIHGDDNMPVIACGSSTGQIRHVKRGKTYLSYNVLKYDPRKEKIISCAVYFEDIVGSGVQHLKTKLFV
ncbi:metallophosphoesterase [Anaerosinus sp.]|uniref:metallophosphoesterase n=1 Tax=Selenobaculum sp. TaxID=3074374 RepID=UPI003AB5D975